jgi:SAM dependent carboxyl methyltransferase
MAPMGIAIDAVRRRAGPSREVEIVHTDLPSNDFTALFNTILSDPSSYLVDPTDIVPTAIGRSYFESLMRPRSVHLAWNTWSMQWMSHLPGMASDHVLAGMSKNADLLEAVARIQMKDWEKFLTMRAQELRPGGRLLTAFTARTAQETGWEWLLDELWASVLDLVADRTLDVDEAERMTIPIGLRLLDDLRRPFQEGAFEGLIAERIELERVDDAHWAEFERTGDSAAFASRHAEATRASAGATLAGALNPEQSGAGVLDLLFSRHAKRLAVNPERHRPYMAFALLTKIA